jgi:hypothetical protein
MDSIIKSTLYANFINVSVYIFNNQYLITNFLIFSVFETLEERVRDRWEGKSVPKG